MNITINGMRETTFSNILTNYAPDELKTSLFSNLRVFIDDIENFWFIGSEVANIMGYSDTDQAIRKNVPEEYKIGSPSSRRGTLGGNPNIILIHELGLYALAMRSRLPQAYQFQDWVYRVISKIRQYGGYINPNLKQIVDVVPEQYRQYFSNMLEDKNRIIEEMRPKVEFYDRAMDSSNAVSMTVIAKDFGMSANELHNLLYKLGIIYRISDTWVLYKQYQGKGYTATKSAVNLTDQFGDVHNDVEIATYWTEKGRGFIYGLLGANNIFPLVER